MQTHYAKMTPKDKNMNDVFGSLVYSLLPNDTLLTKQSIINNVFNYFDNHPEECRGMTRKVSEIGRTIDNLTKNGYIKELYSSRLDKFIRSL